MTILIIYATQTGNSRQIANIICKALKYGYNDKTLYNIEEPNPENNRIIYMCAMENFDFTKLHTCSCIIFVCSTQGDGNEPFGMRSFWKFLKQKNLPVTYLSNLSFAVYGLGDSSYDKFNYASKKLHNRLVSLGANPIIARGDGDIQDKNGYYTTFIPWLCELYKKTKDLGKPHSEIVEVWQKKMTYDAKVISTKYLTPLGYDKPILEVRLQIKDYDSYTPGDCIEIRPDNYNSKEFEVYNSLTSICTSNLEIEFMRKRNIKSVASAVHTFFDINFVPDQLIFHSLYRHVIENPNLCTDGILKYKQVCDKLNEIFGDYGLYYDYVYKEKKTFFAVLKDFGIKINFIFLINNVPEIMPRYFTLVKIDNEYCIYVSLVQVKMAKKGLCSEYLKNLKPGNELCLGIEKSNLHHKTEKYLFFVTGTGMALPWSFLNYYKNREYVIFYGFRYKSKDQLFAKEIIQKKIENKIKLYNAVSKEDDRLYIQSLFANNYIENIDEYTIFVCGNANLNKEIKKVLNRVYNRNIGFQSETW